MKIMALLLVCTLLFWEAHARAGEIPKPEEEIKIENFSFVPGTLTVKKGTTVRWVNRDDSPHTVVSTPKGFASNVLDTDDKYTHTFAAPGSYEYYCSVHPHMKGKVIVQ